MSSLIDLISGFGIWNWAFLAIVLLAFETMIPGVHFLWFGLAAAVVGAIAYLAGAAGYGDLFTWPWQLVLYALISVATVFWVKTFARPETAKSDEPDLNVRGVQYIGRVVTVENDIANGRGKVRVGDTLWPAEGPDAAAGSRVKITGVNGTVFRVEPASA
jgi:hypothetical protein